MERVKISVSARNLPTEMISESASLFSAILNDETSNPKMGTIENSIVKWELTWERGFVLGCVQEFTLTIYKRTVDLPEEEIAQVTFLLHSILAEPTRISTFNVPIGNQSVLIEISPTVVGGLRDLFSALFSIQLEKSPWFFLNPNYHIAFSNRINDFVWGNSPTGTGFFNDSVHWGVASASCKALCDNNFNAVLDVKLWKHKVTGQKLKGQTIVPPLQLNLPDSDHVRDGWRFKLSVVMDFSRSHEFIHKLEGAGSICSDILEKLTANLEVLQWFRGPQLFGFDAHLSQYTGGHSVVSHFFPTPSTYMSSSKQGLSVQGRVQAEYSALLSNVTTYGHTVKLFGPTLSHFLRSPRVAMEYSVVFVVSDKEISDFATGGTIADIAAASALPLSIVFIGGLSSPVAELGTPNPSTRSIRSCSDPRAPSTTSIYAAASSSSTSITTGNGSGSGSNVPMPLSEQSCVALNAHGRRELFSFCSLHYSAAE
eukprot:gene26059-34664_t